MSTFNGLVPEFPAIRIDFFRQYANTTPPLACFLSHVHSDHLAGLESLRSPFVYCSAATREILLRLERYPCRINRAKGILEARQQTYRHLQKVLKPLPLETPTVIELQPGNHIQVTLFDANHCPGATMFLIEGNEKAILYTGDIRCEPWFVNNLARNPSIIEYTYGTKTLDKLYLDTSHTADVTFQTKAEGLVELLHKVSLYPQDTVFHFQAWTYGYEDVWIALSKALKSPVHVDAYKLSIYNSLRRHASINGPYTETHLSHEAPALTGFICGNFPHPGCLTADASVRLHSCERGNMCHKAKHPSVVKIQPIVAHLPGGKDLCEAGIGGGGDDLEREAELSFFSAEDIAILEDMATQLLHNDDEKNEWKKIITQASISGRSLPLALEMATFDKKLSADLRTIIQTMSARHRKGPKTNIKALNNGELNFLPNTINFPFSRHSSYPELCRLVEVFKPKDVWPCTVDIEDWIKDDISIQSLFGKYCSGDNFEHDAKIRAIAKEAAEIGWGDLPQEEESQPEDDSWVRLISSPPGQVAERGQRILSPVGDIYHVSDVAQSGRRSALEVQVDDVNTVGRGQEASAEHQQASARKRSFQDYEAGGKDLIELTDTNLEEAQAVEAGDSQQTEQSFSSALSMRHAPTRHDAYYQMLENVENDEWKPITMISTGDNHSVMDKEL